MGFLPRNTCTGLAFSDFPWASLLFSLSLSYKWEDRSQLEFTVFLKVKVCLFFYGNEANSLLMAFVQLHATCSAKG